MAGRLEGKIGLVTGASSGLGEATAMRFAREGGIPIIGARDTQKGEEVVHKIKKEKREALFIRLDVTEEASWIDALKMIDKTFARLDILINNAGVGLSGSITSFSLKDWRTVMSVNLDGVFLGMKYAIPLMEKNGKGNIVNIASIDGINGVPEASAYCASKAGVRLLTKSVALECAEGKKNIRVNVLSPGSFHSPMVEKAAQWPERVKRLGLEDAINMRAMHIPLNRLATYEELVNGIIFLASDEASYITGSELIIDGGVTAG